MTCPRQLNGTAKSGTGAFIGLYQVLQESNHTPQCLKVGLRLTSCVTLGKLAFVPQFPYLWEPDRPHFKKVVVKIVFIYAKHYRSVSCYYHYYYQTTILLSGGVFFVS